MKQSIGKNNLDLLLLATMLLAFGFLAYRIAAQAPEPEEKGRPHRTTYSVQPGGLKAWYLLLQKQGIRVSRWERPPADWPNDASVIITTTLPAISAKGMQVWSAAEVKSAFKWVEAGGTLLVLSEEDNELVEKLGMGVSEHLTDDANLSPRQPSMFFQGVQSVRIPGASRFDKTPEAAIPLLADRKPAFIGVARKKGMILAFSTPAIAENRSITTADNARFLTQTVAAYAGTGRVLFDEYHQGYAQGDSFWKAIGRPGQLVAYQLLIITLLAAYTAGKRFGLPRPLPQPPRVSSEYVTSLADLYRRAGASDAALEGVYLSFWRDLCRSAGMPLDSDAEAVIPPAVAALSGSGNTNRDDLEKRLRRLLLECEQKISSKSDTKSGSISDADLLRLSQQMEALRKDLQLGGQD